MNYACKLGTCRGGESNVGSLSSPPTPTPPFLSRARALSLRCSAHVVKVKRVMPEMDGEHDGRVAAC